MQRNLYALYTVNGVIKKIQAINVRFQQRVIYIKVVEKYKETISI